MAGRGIRRGGAITLSLVLFSACGGNCSSSTPAISYTGYVLNSGDGTMTPFALDSGIPGTPITVGEPLKVWSLAITPDGKTAYVAEESSGISDTGVVKLFSLPRGVVQPVSITVPAGPKQMAMAPDGKTIYLVDINQSEVIPIDVASNKLLATIVVGNQAMGSQVYGIVISQDSKTAYVSNFSASSVIPIDLVSKTVLQPFSLPGAGLMALSADGKVLYVAVGKTVVPLTLATQKAGVAIVVDFRLTGMVVSPDAKTLYLVNSTKEEVETLSVTNTGAVPNFGTPTPVGKSPVSIALGKESK